MTPWLQDADVRLYHGDVLQVLRELPAESVDCCVTSPPYWGLRDYGTGAWEGGDEGCDHIAPPIGGAQRGSDKSTIGPKKDGLPGNSVWEATKGAQYKSVCGKCGATRIDQQLGLEPTPEEYVTRMVEVFREVRRVLAPHGTVWLNLGDSYSGGGGFAPDAPINQRRAEEGTGFDGNFRFSPRVQDRQPAGKPKGISTPGLKPKDLVGIPWRVAFALQADGWYLRSDIIWAKPNPMPESVTDRPTKAHEYVFLLSKQPRYFFDQEAVREKYGDNTHHGLSVDRKQFFGVKAGVTGGHLNGAETVEFHPTGRNIRSVWEIATQPYPEAHFATFPEELARRCIAAGTSERGRCPECGSPWVRLTDVTFDAQGRTTNGPRSTERRHESPGRDVRMVKNVETLGWQPSCVHRTLVRRCVARGQPCHDHCACPDVKGEPLAPIPCVVLDPFIGSGTVAHVARKLGRHAVGIDLNESYLQLAARRLQQQSLFADVT